MRKSRWKVEEKNLLLEMRHSSYSVKAIAKTLGRSFYSVNKALNRYNVGKKPYHPSIRPDRYHYEVPTLIKAKINKHKSDKQLHWISSSDMIDWMNNHDVDIQKKTCPATGKIFYVLGCIHLTPGQIVYRFNRLREKLGLPTLFVQGFTW